MRQHAQPAHAADRCAREIAGILAAVVVRSRRLMGNPLGGWAAWLSDRLRINQARSRTPVVPALVVPAPVVLVWYARSWCCSPVVLGVIGCRVWFPAAPVVPCGSMLVWCAHAGSRPAFFASAP